MKDRTTDKLVLDACCGGRMFWFDKQNPLAFFIDNRTVEPHMVGKGRNARKFAVQPDAVMDFRDMDFADNSFYLTVFDPPHMRDNAAGYMSMKYGKLPKEWAEYLRAGLDECFRVTKPNGVIIFKWNEVYLPTSKLIEALGRQPLFGHTTNNRGTTKWLCFIKAGHETV
jgi:SAM-dependent methyltransferase